LRVHATYFMHGLANDGDLFRAYAHC
jgi:hypothetical protein